MALIFMDGFEMNDGPLKWNYAYGYSTANTSPRCGTGYYATGVISGVTLSLQKNFTAAAQVTTGVAVRTASSGTTKIAFFTDGGSSLQITVFINSARYIEIRRGSSTGTLLATGTTQLALNSWFYIEAQASVSATFGTVTVRLNGSTTPEVTYTGITKNGGTSTMIDMVEFDNQGSFDDCYILDSTSTSNTTFLGDVRVFALAPNGNGTYSQFTGSDGDSVNNYQLVNESPYSTANYVGSSTVGSRDTYAMSDLPGTVNKVFGVQNNLIAAKSDAGTANIKSALNIGGSLYYGAVRALCTSYASYQDVYNTNPSTSSTWTVTDINNLEDGTEVA